MRETAPEAANRSSFSAKARWAASKNGQCRCSRVGPVIESVPFEPRLGLGRERLECTAEIAGGHALRLRLGLGVDQVVEAHVPFLVQHALGDAMGQPRAV